MSPNPWHQGDPWADVNRGDGPRDEDHHDWAADIREGRAHYLRGVTASTSQSGLGIASLILSLVAGVMIAASMIVAALMALDNPNVAEGNPQVMGVGCGILFGLVLSVPAGILGLIGLMQPDQGKICAVLGVLFATVEFFGVAGLLLLGLLLA